jgi:hypothetical protein
MFSNVRYCVAVSQSLHSQTFTITMTSTNSMTSTNAQLFIRKAVLASSNDNCTELRSSIVAGIDKAEPGLRRRAGAKKLIYQVQ